jgi:UDPglucose--hexose-1-phosphate uridylyltransferase
MPEYRQDPLTGRMVIVAEERAARPHQFDIAERPFQGVCPFCEGNESYTPSEITAFRSPDSEPNSPGWRVRVVPNKYPAVVTGEVTKDFYSRLVADGRADGIGMHEVIIDTPRHVLSVADLTPTEVADMLAMYRLRIQTIRADSRWEFVQIFKNVGAAAGASLPHSHSQLVAMPFMPYSLFSTLQRAAHFYDHDKRCLWCERIESEKQACERIVEETEHFIVLCPYVSRFAGEIEIYPKHHESGFDQVDVSLLPELAELFRRTVIRLEKAVFWMKDSLAYNIVLNTQSFRPVIKKTIFPRKEREISSFFHWHFSILPSLARAAGFEWGTGLHINPISPEKAAQHLREAVR